MDRQQRRRRATFASAQFRGASTLAPLFHTKPASARLRSGGVLWDSPFVKHHPTLVAAGSAALAASCRFAALGRAPAPRVFAAQFSREFS